MDSLCERCGGFTDEKGLEEYSLMSRGKPLASWMLCYACRVRLRVEDLMELLSRQIKEINDDKE